MKIEPYLSENDQKEAFSYAYLHALAAECGYSCQEGPRPDSDSIDATIRAKGGMRAQIDVQLKATAVAVAKDGDLRFRLRRKNYNDLCAPRLTPLVLVVLELPREREEWLSWSPEELILRRRAWWLVLEGATAIESETKTVVLPDSQLLSPDELRGIIDRAAKGDLP